MAGLGDAANWTHAAEYYKKLTVDVGRKPITAVLSFADSLSPFNQASSILDNGCGPGPIMERLIETYQLPENCKLTCTDRNEAMVAQVLEMKGQKTAADNASPWTRVQAIAQDAMDMKAIGDASLSHITAGWVYFLTPDPQKCLSESIRMLNPGGVLSLSSWHSNQWMDMAMCIKQLRPNQQMFSIPEAWMTVEGVRGEMEAAGFKDVICEYVETNFPFQRMEALVDFLFSSQLFLGTKTEDLSESEKVELRDHLFAKGRSYCPNEPGELKGKTVIAAGRKPL